MSRSARQNLSPVVGNYLGTAVRALRARNFGMRNVRRVHLTDIWSWYRVELRVGDHLGRSEELVSRCVECDLAEPESLASLGSSAPGVVDGILSPRSCAMKLGDVDSNWSTDTTCPGYVAVLAVPLLSPLTLQGLFIILPYWQAAQKGV